MNQLTLVERATLAIGYPKNVGALIELASESKNITVVTNQGGYQDAQSRRMVLRSTRTEIERLGKAARADATAFSKAIIAEEAKLLALIEPEEKRLKKLQDDYDAKVAAERQAAATAEANRIANIQTRINNLRANLQFGATSDEIAKRGEVIANVQVDDLFEEFYGEAVAVKKQALDELATAWTNTVALEASAAENAKLKEQIKALQPALVSVEPVIIPSPSPILVQPVKMNPTGKTTFDEISIKRIDGEITDVLFSSYGSPSISIADLELADLINELSMFLDDRYK